MRFYSNVKYYCATPFATKNSDNLRINSSQVLNSKLNGGKSVIPFIAVHVAKCNPESAMNSATDIVQISVRLLANIPEFSSWLLSFLCLAYLHLFCYFCQPPKQIVPIRKCGPLRHFSEFIGNENNFKSFIF